MTLQYIIEPNNITTYYRQVTLNNIDQQIANIGEIVVTQNA